MRGQIKDKLYYYFAQKNWGVNREYGPYVDAHQEEHAKHPWKHRWMLIRLNWHYRVLRRKNYLYNKENQGGNEKRQPYLKGSESSISNRRPVLSVTQELLQYDVISFDIFDTLLLRPFQRPSDLFVIVGSRLNKTGFYDIRMRAERRARDEALKAKGNREVTIFDIYKIIEEQTGIPSELGVSTEFGVELDYCFANPYMKKIFRLIQEHGKTIVITSDMYLPAELMTKLLEKSGFIGHEKLYISCDYGCSKSSGELFRCLIKDYSRKRIIHIGDNQKVDIVQANKNNIACVFYEGCHSIGSKYRADGMSQLVGSAYAGIVNTHLHCDETVFSPYYEYGFTYGGLFITGFCNWIHTQAKSDNIDKVLFLSRDGVIFQKVFNMMFSDFPNEYFLWSRIANTKYTLKKNKEDFLQRIVRDRAIRTEAIFSAAMLLDSISLSELKPLLSKHGLKESTLLTSETVDQFELFFIKEWDYVLARYDLEKEQIKQYISQKIKNCKKIAIVDIGWFGSGPISLKYLIEEEFQFDCKVCCYLGGSTGRSETYCPNALMDNTIKPYMFSAMLNRYNYNWHKKTNNGVNSIFFEFFSQAKTPSYAGIDENGQFQFDIPELENYSVTQDIHNGIMDFAHLYYYTFRKDIWMLNIAGYDAYCPFRFIVQNLTFIKKYFSGISVARGIGGDQEHQKIVSADAIMKRIGAWEQ